MTERDLPPLNALRAFEATARLQSVSRAAEALHVTHGAVSRQIRQLEEALGRPLFARQGRGLVLTEAGERLREAASGAFDGLRDAWAALRQPSSAPFVLGCPRSEEHTSELQSHVNLVCRLLLEKKNNEHDH